VAYLAALGLVFIASVGLSVFSRKGEKNKVLIKSDGIGYYVWARSIVLDHDIDFGNDYQVMCEAASGPVPPEAAVSTPTGYSINKYPVGMAVLEIPGLLLGHIVASHSASFATDGASPPYQVAVVWSLFDLYYGSFVFLYRAMLCLGIARIWAAGFCLTALLATNLIYYAAKEPTMAHAAGVAVFNVLLFLAVGWTEASAQARSVPRILAGALLGLFFLVRNTNVLLIPFLAVVLWTRRRILLREVMPVLAGALVVSALQPVSLWFLWGRPRFSTYFGESFSAGFSGIGNALVSAKHGLLLYHPWYGVLLLFAAYGVLSLPKARTICIAVLASFVFAAVVNGTCWCWWFGHSFGNRAFIELLPALSLAAAMSISELNVGRRATICLVAAMLVVTAVNAYLSVGYVLERFPHDGSHTIAQAYLWLLSSSPGR